ncbi:uncharacterized protein [Nicotiana tomentosiformis]|uniref:uncharacterized protein n=1 Tax=Nicotiana tomentosiformis TaxID=4098 RepID=UPI00388C86C9
MAVDMNIKELLFIGDSDLLIHQVQGEWSTKNVKTLPYMHYVKELCKKFTKIEFKHAPRIQNEFVDALVTLSSMIQHPDKNHIDPIETTMRTSTGATPYMLVYNTEAVIPAEVEILSLRVIQQAKLDDAEWIRIRQEQLMLIDEKRIDAVCHGQLYQSRMASAFNKRVQFTLGQLVLKKIFPYKEEAKGKFTLN